MLTVKTDSIGVLSTTTIQKNLQTQTRTLSRPQTLLRPSAGYPVTAYEFQYTHQCLFQYYPAAIVHHNNASMGLDLFVYAFCFKWLRITQLEPLSSCRSSSRGTVHLQEYLEVELDRADRVWQLKFVQHAGVQNTKDTDGVVLAGEVDLDGCCMAGEESLVCLVLAIRLHPEPRVQETCALASPGTYPRLLLSSSPPAQHSSDRPPGS